MLSMFSHLRTFSLFALSFLALHCNGRKYSWNTQDAWLYPGRLQKGIHLTYSDSTDWSDLWKIMSERGFYTAGTLCIKGIFVLYQEPLYAVSKPNSFEILSGNLRCTMISENTKSIQLIGSVGRMYGPSITFFEKPYFGSAAFSTVVNVGSDFFQKMEHTRSAIMVGRAPWTITLSTGDTICVQPEFDPLEMKPICLIRDFMSLLDTSTDDDNDENGATDSEKEILKNNTIILKASLGCRKVKDEESIYRIQDCLYWGRTKKTKEVQIQFEETKKALGGRSDGGRPRSSNSLCDGDDAAKRIFKLYKAVVTKTFDTDLLVGLDMIGKHSWKLDLLDWIFTIVIHVIPDDVIPNSFLNKVRELFVHKLVTVWNNNNTEADANIPEITLTERNYQALLLLLEQCENAIVTDTANQEDGGASAASILSDEFVGMWNNIQSMDDFKDLINSEFEREPSLDIISEMVWIVGHMTGYICHAQHMSTSHFWALYFNMFWNLYMLPVTPEWGKATQGLNIFFGGLNYKEEYNKLAMFAGVTRKQARNMEPLHRPSGVLSSGSGATRIAKSGTVT